jgi:hypothetical protein
MQQGIGLAAPSGRNERTMSRTVLYPAVCGSDRGGQRAAIISTLNQTAKLNDIDPQAWLADALARIAEHPATRLDQLLPWNWVPFPLKADPDSHIVTVCKTVQSPN